MITKSDLAATTAACSQSNGTASSTGTDTCVIKQSNCASPICHPLKMAKPQSASEATMCNGHPMEVVDELSGLKLGKGKGKADGLKDTNTTLEDGQINGGISSTAKVVKVNAVEMDDFPAAPGNASASGNGFAMPYNNTGSMEASNEVLNIATLFYKLLSN